MTPEEVLQFAKKHDAKMVDFKFVDVPGTWQHFTVPLHELELETFVEGKASDLKRYCNLPKSMTRKWWISSSLTFPVRGNTSLCHCTSLNSRRLWKGKRPI